MKKLLPFVCCLSLLSTLLSSCGKMDEIHRGFYEDGEIVYPGKADSLRAHPGRYRLALSWLILADPRVRKAVVYWNNRQDSLELPVHQAPGADTVRVMFGDLEERAYTFEVYTFDDEGNRSVRSEVLGMVYGDVYESSLLNRAIRSKAVVKGKPVLEWMPAEGSVLRSEVTYTNIDGELRRLLVPASEDSTWLPGFPPGGTLRYRTFFLPDSLAIDTFLSQYDEEILEAELFERPEVELDKSKFVAFPLPTDTYEPYSSPANSMDKIWDGVLNSDGPTFLTAPGTPMPQWFTFDLGTTSVLTRMKLYQRGLNSTRLYQGGNVRKFEIWGATDPNPDGSFDDSWTLLGEFESVKPSGSPAGQMNSEDLNYILAGEDFQFENAPPVRYLRFKTVANWDANNRGYTNIGEVTFWREEE